MADIPTKQSAVPARAGNLASIQQLIVGSERAPTILLGAIILLALILRFWGLRFGLPYLEHPDEWAVAEDAIRILQTGNWSPFSFTYPTLYTYLQVGVAALHYAWGLGSGVYQQVSDIEPARYYVWARSLTALLGTGAVLLTYVVGRRLYGRTAGLLAAAFLATYPAAAGDSHYVTVDTPAMFFTLVALYAIARLLPALDDEQQANHWRRSFLVRSLVAGVAVGLASATKYNAGVLVLPLLGATLFLQQLPTHALRSRLCSGFVALCGVALGFTLGTPLWLPELARLLDDLASIAVHYRVTGHPGAESSRPALWYWGAFQNEGRLLAWAFLGGVLLGCVRRKRADLLLLCFVIPYYIQLSSVKVVFFRNTMPLLPWLCLLAAAAIVAAIGWALQRRGQHETVLARYGQPVISAIALVLLIAQPLAKAWHDEWLRAQPTTRVLATDWLLARAPSGARIWLEDQTLLLPARLRVQGGRPITDNPPEWYRDAGFHYLVVNESIAKDDPQKLPAFGAPVARFEAAGVRHGHSFAIYATGVGDTAQEPPILSGMTLGNGAIVLKGVGYTGKVKAGEILQLAVFWKVERELPHDYIVFVHLLDANNEKVAQRDTPPLDGAIPTSQWEPGKTFRDDQDLAIPASVAPGTYRLVIGMYDGQTLVSITDGGPIDLGEVVVLPPAQ